MADIKNKLFNFGAKLNAPFTGTPIKVLGAKSKYSSSTMSTISSTVLNMTLCILNTRAHKPECNTLAIGESANGKGIVEYHRYNNSQVDLVAYEPEDGSVIALCYDEDSKHSENYVLGGNRDGKAILAAMWPTLMTDSEFEETFKSLEKEYKEGFSDKDTAVNLFAILSDNVYRRVKEEGGSASVYLDIPETGTISKMKNVSILSGVYSPESIIEGEFAIFDSSEATVVSPSAPKKKARTVEDLEGKYIINPARKFSEEEKNLIPHLESWYIPGKEDFDICNTVVKTTATAMPFRNFVFRGGAGSGKSAKARAVAAGLGLPFGFYTCSANTEIFDLVGQVMPATKNEKNREAAQLFDRFEKLGGVSIKNISTVLGLPSVEDVEFMPVETYEMITGKKTLPDGSTPTAIEVMKTWSEFMMTKCNEVLDLISGGTSNNKFVYTETPFIKAIKNGWVFEIQEPNVIASEGVIVGLNGLLQEGRIVLPTGEVVERHPESIIIFTTNVSYNGCRDMNQSVIDRGSEVFDIETPPVEAMQERAMAISGFTDEKKAKEMAEIISDIGKTMAETGIDDGVCGMRSLIAWMIKTSIGYDPYQAALSTVISKTSGDPEARGALLKRLDESSFKKISRRRSR